MTENINSLIAVAKSAANMTKKGHITIQRLAIRAEADLARLERMEKALRLIEQSYTFKGGTFVRELQEIARRPLDENATGSLLPVY